VHILRINCAETIQDRPGQPADDVARLMSIVYKLCSPFSVSPQTASVDVGSLLQLDVTYRPTRNSNHLADLLVKYSIGLSTNNTLYFILNTLAAVTPPS